MPSVSIFPGCRCDSPGVASLQPTPRFKHHPYPGPVAEQALHHPGDPSAPGKAPELPAWPQDNQELGLQRDAELAYDHRWPNLSFSYACKFASKILLARSCTFM